MKPLSRLVAAAMLFAVVPAATHAQAPAPGAQPADAPLAARAAEAIAVLRGEGAAEAVFSPAFLKAVPPAQLEALAAGLAAQHGAITGADALIPTSALSGRFTLRLERALATAALELEAAPPHRISGLRITDLRPLDDGPQQILRDFAALPGAAGFGLYRLGQGAPQPVFVLHPERQLAVGSAFKLWVLDALAEDIARGRRKWSDVVTLGLRSLPSGELQDWPESASVTLETLATLMIAKSDNTATDTLIRVLGRKAVEARIRASGHAEPARTVPLLTTLEAFTLKAGPPEALAAYARADDAAQVAQLARMAPMLDPARIPPGALGADRPRGIAEAEWFASAADLARALDGLRRRSDPRVLAILAVNPGISPARRAALDYAGFKGGSEAGVLNLTHLVRNRRGEWYALVASWNDPAAPLDEARLITLAQRLLDRVQ